MGGESFLDVVHLDSPWGVLALPKQPVDEHLQTHKHIQIHSNTVSCLKELEHRKLGGKVLILKYDLDKSLSKEMRCKMA